MHTPKNKLVFIKDQYVLRIWTPHPFFRPCDTCFRSDMEERKHVKKIGFRQLAQYDRDYVDKG